LHNQKRHAAGLLKYNACTSEKTTHPCNDFAAQIVRERGHIALLLEVSHERLFQGRLELANPTLESTHDHFA
jgi:hypothetical protein